MCLENKRAINTPFALSKLNKELYRNVNFYKLLSSSLLFHSVSLSRGLFGHLGKYFISKTRKWKIKKLHKYLIMRKLCEFKEMLLVEASC